MKVARYQVPGVGFNTPPVPDGSLFLNASPVRRGGYWASFIEFRRDKNGIGFRPTTPLPLSREPSLRCTFRCFEICRRLFHFAHFLIEGRALPIGQSIIFIK
jgi:hypothetical protein